MNQKQKIISLLRVNGVMTQGKLAEAIYGNKLHAPNIYSALMSLVENKNVIRTGARPAQYSLNEICPSEDEEIRKHCFSNSDSTALLQAKEKQQSVTMSVKKAVSLIQSYFNETIRDVYGRFMSWVYCYKIFSEKRNVIDEETVDYLALHLAFYLASWGMYRGSSFLLQKSYKIHIPVVQIIQEEKYNLLFGISADNLCKERSLLLLEDIGERIKTYYAKEKAVRDGKLNNATDTLITKILLGTLGCVPAYDRYYVQSVRKHNVSNGIYDRQSVRCIANFYCNNFVEFEKLRQKLSKSGIDYPPMKLMDMCFWQDGYMKNLEQR